MGFYERHILPHIIHLAMGRRDLLAYRQRVTGAAEGRVLEIGIGSGLNLPLYAADTDRIIGLDPSPRLLRMAHGHAEQARRPVDLLRGSAEAIPLDDRSIDTVVTTWTLCSIPDLRRALAEIRRVLTAEGRLLFVEHGRAPEPSVREWQDRLTPIIKRLGGGCHLNRPIAEILEREGFRFDQLHTGYMHGPKVGSFMYEGAAVVA
jgi:ubiquinone/menaquinone biosynthesis C-methylase UbiE